MKLSKVLNYQPVFNKLLLGLGFSVKRSRKEGKGSLGSFNTFQFSTLAKPNSKREINTINEE